MGKEKVLILGSRGLLGTSFREYIKRNEISDVEFLYGVRTENDIETDNDIVFDILKAKDYVSVFEDVDIIINCVAYTDVDKAETDEMNYALNHEAVKKLSQLCKDYNVYLIHFSTDFVFSGFKIVKNFTEIDLKYPANQYGKAKAWGDSAVENSGCDYLIFRISWLYSEFKSNFITKIYNKLSNNEDVTAINDIISGLTYADDLAGEIIRMILTKKIYEKQVKNRVFNYRNDGDVSVYDIALYIKNYCDSNGEVKPVSRDEFAFKAIRPSFSSLVTDSFKITFNNTIPFWDESLKKCLDRYQKLV